MISRYAGYNTTHRSPSTQFACLLQKRRCLRLSRLTLRPSKKKLIILNKNPFKAATGNRFVHCLSYSVLPPAWSRVIVTSYQGTCLDLGEVHFQILLHEFVTMVAVDVNPIEIVVRKQRAALLRATPVNLDDS